MKIPTITPLSTSSGLPEAHVQPLPEHVLNSMINHALMHPQLTNQSTQTQTSKSMNKVIIFPLQPMWTKRLGTHVFTKLAAIGTGSAALAASLILAVSLYMSPQQNNSHSPVTPLQSDSTTSTTPHYATDPLADITDMITYDILG